MYDYVINVLFYLNYNDCFVKREKGGFFEIRFNLSYKELNKSILW